jgi:hypothetical protein
MESESVDVLGDRVPMRQRREIAIEFDGPWHFMKKGKESKDRVGPIDARTRKNRRPSSPQLMPNSE